MAAIPDLAQFLDGANTVPHELVHVGSRLLEHLLVGRVDSFTNLGGGEAVNRIARRHARASPGRLGVEAGRPIPAPEDAAAQIEFAQREHALILIERSAPRHDGREREH